MTTGTRHRLILTRHAKSAWDDPALADEDRPLNPRGRRAARELGDWLASRGYEPEEVLCSDARRTRETWEGVAATPLEVMPKVCYLHDLYAAGPAKMLDVLKTATHDTVMMVGHNPGIAAFAAELPATPLTDPKLRKYPTAATVVLDFAIDDWRDAEPGRASLLDSFLPSHGD